MLHDNLNMIDSNMSEATPNHGNVYEQALPPEDLTEHLLEALSSSPPSRQNSHPSLTLDTSFISTSSSEHTPSAPPSYDAATDLEQMTLQIPTEPKITAPRPTPVSAEPVSGLVAIPEAALSAPELPGIPKPQQTNKPLFNRNRSSIPLHNLDMTAAVVDCPICNNRGMTRTQKPTGNNQHSWTFGATALSNILGFFPSMMQSRRDVQHYCGACDSHLVNWNKSGTVEVLAQGIV